MRPTGPADVFVVPEAMETMMRESGRTDTIVDFSPRKAMIALSRGIVPDSGTPSEEATEKKASAITKEDDNKSEPEET